MGATLDLVQVARARLGIDSDKKLGHPSASLGPLPDALKSFVDEQVAERGYGTSSEYIRELIRKDQDRAQLRSLLLQGAAS